MRRNCGLAVPSAPSILFVIALLGIALGATTASAQPTLMSASNSDDTTVVVDFSESIDSTTGNVTGNYLLFESDTPSNTVGISGASTSGSQVTLTLASSLGVGTAYTLRVQNVENLSGQPIGAGAQTTFTATGAAATPIATIQANPSAYEGQTVTVEGIVYIPTDYRGTTVSGYIQDDSGRGINLFGTGMDVAALQTVGNRVRVTGTVELYFTTVEITTPTEVTLLESGLQRPAPVQQSTGAAANSQWEGTFIEVTGTISAQAVGGPGVNYTVNDGSGPIVVRVVDTLGAPSFSNGQTITARGAGGQFSTDFQVNVGLTSDVFSGQAEFNVTGASASDANTVLVNFSGAVNTTTGAVAGNYSVYPTSNPGSAVTPTSATVSGSSVQLTLAASLTDGTGYTVQVTGVTSESGDPLGSTSSATFTYSASNAIPIATIQANPSAYEGQEVTVEGIVYIPSDYRGATVSGYIQDSSNRGINLFGTGFDVPATQTVGNRVRVTGTVEIYFTTVEITNPTEVTVLQTGLSRPAPVQQSTGAAANSQWEGTFIEVTGTISAQAVGGPGVNYTVNDGSGPIVVRVVDTLGAPSFSNGQTITARGAGGQFGSDFQVNVGLVGDVSSQQVVFGVSSATANDANTVQVNFTDDVNTTNGAVPGNYSVYPAGSPGSGVTPTSAVVAGRSVTLTLANAMTDGSDYTVAVSNVTSTGGDPITGNSTADFRYSESGVIPIAVIQADPGSFEGQTVTVEGSVYIPSDYRGSTTSGFIQDSSGRGINVFGSGMNVSALTTIGNQVRITATVELYFTTVELTNPTDVTLLGTGPRPQPQQLSTGQGASSDWEGTFIECSGPVTDIVQQSTATNYTINDGSGPIVVRIVDTVSAPAFSLDTIITARGAGGQYQSDYQILVGLTSDVFEGGGEDITPPRVLRASLKTSQLVLVDFDEEVDPVTAGDAANYSVFRTGDAGQTSEVVAAVRSGKTRVELSLASAIYLSEGWSVNVVNVKDIPGNAIQPPGVTVEIKALLKEKVDLEGPPFTFLPRDGERYPLTVDLTSEIANDPSAEVLLRIFDLNGTLVSTLYDSRRNETPSSDFSDNRATFEWDGKDDYGNLVSAGAYVAHLQVRVRGGDGTHEAHIPVVVATRLDR